MSNNLVEQWDDYVESMGSVMGEVEHMAQRMADRIVELEARLAKAVQLIKLSVELGRWDLNPSLRDEMIDFTTELTGGKDE